MKKLDFSMNLYQEKSRPKVYIKQISEKNNLVELTIEEVEQSLKEY